MHTNCHRPDGTLCNSPKYCANRGGCPFGEVGKTDDIVSSLDTRRRMHVLVDVDGVVADLMPVWLGRYNAVFCDVLRCDDVTGWDLRSFVKPEAASAIYDFLDTADLYDDVQPIVHALDGVLALRADGHRVTFVTTAVNGHAGAKLRWLQREGFLPDNKKVDPDYIECSDKSLIRGDVLVDDRHSTVRDYPGRTIMFMAPHNASEYTPDMFAYNWDDVVKNVARLVQGTDAPWSNRPDLTTPPFIGQPDVLRNFDMQSRPMDSPLTPFGRSLMEDAIPGMRKKNAEMAAKLDAVSAKPSNPKDIIGSNKLPLTLFPASAIAMGCLGMLNGLCKYGRDNFRAIGIRASIYADAAVRHLLAWLEAEEHDPIDGVPHLAAALACVAIIVDARAAGKMTDDRKVEGGYHKLVAELEPHVARLRALYADRAPRHYTIADNVSASQHDITAHGTFKRDHPLHGPCGDATGDGE